MQPELRSREDQRDVAGAAELGESGWHLQCGAQTAETGAGWGGEEGGSERAGAQRWRRRLGTQSRHQPEQADRVGAAEPARRTEPRNKAAGRGGCPHFS